VAKGIDCCGPGDITVTPIYSGFMIGRTLPHQGPGPWWAYLTIVTDRDEAIQHARWLAEVGQSRAWFHEGGDNYEAIAAKGSG